MKTISVAVSEGDYEAFLRAARRQRRPLAELVRDAMSHYRAEHLDKHTRSTELPLLRDGILGPLPSRSEAWDEMHPREPSSRRPLRGSISFLTDDEDELFSTGEWWTADE